MSTTIEGTEGTYHRKKGVVPPEDLQAFLDKAGAHLIVIDARNGDFKLEPGDAKTTKNNPLAEFILENPDGSMFRPSALNLPFDRKKNKFDDSMLPKIRINDAGGKEHVPIITHCGGGGRGQKSKVYLESLGFQNGTVQFSL